MRIQITDKSFQQLLQQNSVKTEAEQVHNFPEHTSRCALVDHEVAEIGKIIQQFEHYGSFSVAVLNMQLEQEIELITEQMLSSVNMNFMLSGGIYSRFDHLPQSITLNSSTHNLLYTNNSSGYHIFPKEIRLENIHVSLSPFYFMELCSASSRLTEKLLNHIDKQVPILASAQHGNITMQMAQALHGMITCPFKGAIKKLYMEAKVLELLALQLNQLEQGAQNKVLHLSSSEISLAEELREYLQRNYLQIPALRDIARAFGTNEFKLKKAFRERFGSGIFGYALELKLHHAHEVLSSGSKTIAEVAEEIGYSHANHFTNAFRKHFGYPPSQLKRKS